MIDQNTNAQQIRSEAVPACVACGTAGQPLYKGLRDRLFNAPGEWNIVRCPKCGLWWLNPMPIPEDTLYAYQDYYTHDELPSVNRRKQWMKAVYLHRKYGYSVEGLSLSQQLIGWLSLVDLVQHAWINTRMMYLPHKPQGKLLEIGCGSGDFLWQAQQLGWQTEGIDFDPQAVEVAVKRGLNAHIGTLQAQDYQPDTFDAITMSHVIEHIHDPRSLLAECFRLLKPGGILSFVTPNNAGLTHQFFHDHWFALDPPRHLYLYNRQSIELLLKAAGFSHPNVFTTNHNANAIIIASYSIRQTGKYKIRTKSSFISKTLSKLAEWVEYLGLPFFPNMGEELVVVVRK